MFSSKRTSRHFDGCGWPGGVRREPHVHSLEMLTGKYIQSNQKEKKKERNKRQKSSVTHTDSLEGQI